MISNPFSKTKLELTNMSMNEKNAFSYKSNLNLGTLLEPVYKAYNPYEDIEEKALKEYNNKKIEDFNEIEDKFVKPTFSYDAVKSQELININVRELENDFKREDALKNQINFMFNPREGNTPSQRAKSEQINTLLAEIDNFAIQYNLSQRQKENLKSQVLSNHLAEYIQTKNNLEKSDLERERQKQMTIATGRQPAPASGAGEISKSVGDLDDSAFQAQNISQKLFQNLDKNGLETSVYNTIQQRTITTLIKYITDWNSGVGGLNLKPIPFQMVRYLSDELSLGTDLTLEEKKQMKKILRIVKRGIDENPQ